jgi:hypothetical protein
MKVKLLSSLFFFTSQYNYSQTIKGRAVFNNYAVPKVEVINATTKILTISNANGDFSIAVKANDVLIFVSKAYELKKIAITPQTITENNLIVELILQPEELDEVLITKIPSIKLSSDAKWEQRKLDDYSLAQAANRPKIVGLNNGQIENGANFVRIAGMIIGLFKKEKEPSKKLVSKIEFKTLAKKTYDENFYIGSLNLKPDEIELFLEFCDADSKSKIVSQSNNGLALMDFLFAKNAEFKKLPVVLQP